MAWRKIDVGHPEIHSTAERSHQFISFLCRKRQKTFLEDAKVRDELIQSIYQCFCWLDANDFLVFRFSWLNLMTDGNVWRFVRQIDYRGRFDSRKYHLLIYYYSINSYDLRRYFLLDTLQAVTIKRVPCLGKNLANQFNNAIHTIYAF